MLKDEKATIRKELEFGSNPYKQASYSQLRAFTPAKNITPLQSGPCLGRWIIFDMVSRAF